MGAISRGMVLAAGLGTRMRPLTADTAKPLLRVGGRRLLDHALDRFDAAGVTTRVVNAHWCADQVAAAAAERTGPPVTVLREPALLDTGGGVRAALGLLSPEGAPFYVVNGDAYWLDGPTPALARLARALAAAPDADAVLLLVRGAAIAADIGPGDFTLDPNGRPARRGERMVAPYVYAGVQAARPGLLQHTPEGAFGMMRAWDAALAAGRLRAIVHDGLWFHLSEPRDLAETEARLHGPLPWDAR